MKRWLLSSLAAFAVSMGTPAHALTVGEPFIMSATGQPLHALLPIDAQRWEWRELWVTVQAFQRGLGMSVVLYKPPGSSQEGYLEIRSQSAVHDPAVDVQAIFETYHRVTTYRSPLLIDETLVQQHDLPTSPISHTLTQETTSLSQIAVDKPTKKSKKTKKDTPSSKSTTSEKMEEIVAPVSLPPDHIKSSTYQPPPAFPPSSVKASQGNSKQESKGASPSSSTQELLKKQQALIQKP